MNHFGKVLRILLAMEWLWCCLCYAAPTIQVAPTGLNVPEGEVL